MSRTWIQVARVLLLGQMVIGFAIVQVALAQVVESPTPNENARQLGRIEREVDRLRDIDSEARLRVLEEGMFEVKWLGRCVATAVVGQLVLGVMSAAKARPK